MSLRYRRSVKLGKGVKLNLTKTGVGLTVGGKGAHYSVHSSGRRTTSVGIPGTGLYYQNRTGGSSRKTVGTPHNVGQPQLGVVPMQAAIGHAIGSSNTALAATSDNYAKFREQLNTLFEQRHDLEAELKVAKSKHASMVFAATVKFMSKKAKERRDQQAVVVSDLEQQLTDKVLHVAIGKSPLVTETWPACVSSFQKLMASQRIWDVTFTQAIDKVQARSYASNLINRTLIKRTAAPLDFIACDVECLALPNENGPDIYIYPTFLLVFKSYREFGIYDLKAVKNNLHLTQYVERDGVPPDTEVIGQTWYKTNKDGSRDKRFSGNYQIPVVKYGEWSIEGSNGLQEDYMFSDFQAFVEFAKTFVAHTQVLAKFKSVAQKSGTGERGKSEESAA